jgi:hypothetical protein
MRSFSSVVRRHEKDAIVQQCHPPAATSPWQRRRRDAVATFQPYGGVHTSSRMLAPSSNQTMRRSNTEATTRSQRRDSYGLEIGSTSGYPSIGLQWDRCPGTGTESETDTASILRREALREWVLERDARRAASIGTPSQVPPGPVKGNPFADARVHGDAGSEQGDPGHMWGFSSPLRPDVERGIVVGEPATRGRRRGGIADLLEPRRVSGGPSLPPSRRSSNRSMANFTLPPPPTSGALERRPSVASQSSAEHSADEPLLSPRTSVRD